MNTNPTAINAYLAHTVAIRAKLELRKLADDHFDHTPDVFTKCGATSGDHRIT